MANEFQVTGKVTHVLPLVEGDSRKNPGTKWQKQDYVIETFEEWPKKIAFNIWGEDRIKMADLHIGDTITLTFTVESREYNGRWYTDIRCQSAVKGDAAAAGYGQQPSFGPASPQQGFQAPRPSAPQGGAFGGEQGGADDLPF